MKYVFSHYSILPYSLWHGENVKQNKAKSLITRFILPSKYMDITNKSVFLYVGSA